jgi:plastocyanin
MEVSMNAPFHAAAFVSACLGASAALGANVDLVDNCDPADPGWRAIGGCTAEGGDVTLAEFNALLNSPLSAAVVGHPSWRIESAYSAVDAGARLRVRNFGGREHTFTEVANYGGGFVPPLSTGLIMAPECATAVRVPAGQATELKLSTPGLHRFQCCIHPWMRAAIRVTP